MQLTRDECVRRDGADPLAAFRERFALPPGVIYLDGNSLGARPVAAAARLQQAVEHEWGEGLIRSWNSADWIGLPTRVGDKIGRLIGAAAGETVVADSTSANLFKVLAAALALKPGRTKIVSQRDNFPTDLYIAQGLAAFLGRGHELVLLPDDPDAETVEAALDGDTAVLMLTHVNYRSGRIHDMARLTAAAQRAGAFALWDLAHSAGAVPVDLNAARADFAVGCGYKYLNGGPGAPAFVWVAARHQDAFVQPLSGWMGHAAPFDFDPVYRPATGIARYLCGTPQVLATTALECGVDLMLEADIAAVREKSVALTEAFIALVEARCPQLALASPRDAAERGSQVSFRHPQGYALMQALIDRGVIGDFRAPDLVRFGFTPLYTRHCDVWDAVEVLAQLIDSGDWDRPEFHARAAVT
ncbi:MAG TPA: kynureninase [Rhodocyclaceae bacterium]|nr:kynureninase [Rhodocyclaceae bacterium]